MLTLVQLFDQTRDQLIRKIDEKDQPEQVVRETAIFLDALRLRYLEQTTLTPTQRRLLPFATDVIKATLSTLTAASETEVWQRTSRQPVLPLFNINFKKWGRYAGQGIIILLLFWVLGQDGDWLALLLLSLLLGFEAIKKGQFLLKHASAPIWQAQVRVDRTAFLVKLTDALRTADKILLEATTIQTPQSTHLGLEGYPAILELLQDLLEAKENQDSDFALRKAKAVPALLEQQGIQIETFNGQNHHLFEFLPHLDPYAQTYHTLSPALVKQHRLLSRGRVLEPEFTSQPP